MSPTNKTNPPSTNKPSQPSKVTTALAVLAETYEHRRSTSLAALREREAEIGDRVHSLVDTIETSLAVPEGDDVPGLCALLGDEHIGSYVRAAQAARAIAAIVEAETGASPSLSVSPPVSHSSTPTSAGSPAATATGTVSLAGANRWNFGALRKSAIAAATAAAWPAEKLSSFTGSLATAKKHAEVLAIVRASGLGVVE